MSKSLVAFLSVAALCCVGIDYVQEARKAGLRPGDMTVAAYADTIRDRISETEREDAEKPAPVTFADNARALPAAPTGWQRRDWSVEDATLVGDGAKALTEALIEASGPDGVQVYERNGAMVALHLGSGGTPPRLAKGDPVAVVHGVAFRRVEGSPTTGKTRLIGADLGHGLTLTALVRAPDSDMVNLLTGIRFNELAKSDLPRIDRLVQTEGHLAAGTTGARMGGSGQIARLKVTARKLTGCQALGAGKFCSVGQE
jgi:hypothetical protein